MVVTFQKIGINWEFSQEGKKQSNIVKKTLSCIAA